MRRRIALQSTSCKIVDTFLFRFAEALECARVVASLLEVAMKLATASLPWRKSEILCSELDAGLLHFAIRQQPDKRFVMKIDDLYVIAPRVAKIAAERRLQLEFIFLF